MPEDDDETGGMNFIVPLPEGLQEQIRQQQDHARMVGETWRHEVRQFLVGLSTEQLTMLHRMMDMIEDHPDPAKLATFWHGMIVGLLDGMPAHNVCLGCGNNHDEDLAAIGQEVSTDGE